MKQASLGLGNSTKRTRKREFLTEMERVVPWAALVDTGGAVRPEGRRAARRSRWRRCCASTSCSSGSRCSDPAMEEALHDMPLFRDFAGLGGWSDRLPDETTILRFRHLLEQHKLAPEILRDRQRPAGRTRACCCSAGTVVDATLIAAPSSTKNRQASATREMHQIQEGQPVVLRHEGPHRRGRGVGPGAHRARARRATSTTWSKPTRCCTARRPKPSATAGYQGAAQAARRQARRALEHCHAPGQAQAALDKTKTFGQLTEQLEKLKASIRAKVEHPFRVIKRQFGHVKVRYRGLTKNTAQTDHAVRAVQPVDGAQETGGTG